MQLFFIFQMTSYSPYTILCFEMACMFWFEFSGDQEAIFHFWWHFFWLWMCFLLASSLYVILKTLCLEVKSIGSVFSFILFICVFMYVLLHPFALWIKRSVSSKAQKLPLNYRITRYFMLEKAAGGHFVKPPVQRSLPNVRLHRSIFYWI